MRRFLKNRFKVPEIKYTKYVDENLYWEIASCFKTELPEISILECTRILTIDRKEIESLPQTLIIIPYIYL